MARYTGPKPCPGCGCPGSEKSRYSVADICHECEDIMKLGKATIARNKEDQTEYQSVRIFPFYISGGDAIFNEMKNVARSMNDETKNELTRGKDSVYLGNFSSNNSLQVIVTKGQAEALKALYTTLVTILPAIYSKGKEDGQNLLMQLANGSLTLDKFEEQKKR